MSVMLLYVSKTWAVKKDTVCRQEQRKLEECCVQC
ncbi:hypothetical protein E2C01_088470 [Portunus trituberculatus]|uniref:Uncharacterized protein n=1 Tax=Portunus trituberculatus TaxID=210409 RepID=A0A5B7JGP4_PORTR|nr:hypothetical protein [Portunus trituberculatus]